MDATDRAPLVRPPSAWGTVATWVAFTALCAGCWWAPDAMVFVGAAALGAGIAAVVVTSLRGATAALAGALLVAATVTLGLVTGPGLAIATGAGGAGLAALGGGALLAQNLRYHRKLRALRAALAEGRRVERAAREALHWPPRWFYAATSALIEHHHVAVAERLLRARPITMRTSPHHALQLVTVLLALGKVDEARAAVDAIAALAPNGRELRAYLDARVAVAEGDAAGVLARLTVAPEDGAHAVWGAYRRLALADAAAACGDRERARRLLGELPADHRDRALAILRDSNRPAAAIAAEVLAGTAQPYR